MKIRSFILSVIALSGVFAGCNQTTEYPGIPRLYLSDNVLEFEMSGGVLDIEVTASRDWNIECDADWVAVTPENDVASAEPQKVSVTILENTGFDRTAMVGFSIGMIKKTLTVTQAGPEGSVENLIVYFNDYDKTVATQTYGSGSSWPFLDQFSGWQNQTGTGAAGVTYNFAGMSARANSNSDSNYSDYEGSGDNNMFFGADAYLATKNINLGGATALELTFGTEKYSQNNGSVFLNSEFHIYLSQDGEKWVELKDYTFAGGTTEGRWNVATAVFSVPEGTESLSVCMKTDVASSYRMDDLKIVRTSKQGAAIDFSGAVEMDFTAGGTSSGGGGSADADVPVSAGKKTVAEFISAADGSAYYELTGTVSGFNSQYCSFDLTDSAGDKIYVYSVLAASKTQWASKISNGGTVTILGKYYYFTGKSQHEVVDAYIVSFSGGSDSGSGSGGNVGGDTGGEKGEYDPDGIQWTLGERAYDNTGDYVNNVQTAVVNGVQVNNLLKLGNSTLTGYATLHVPAGTKKIGFYGVSWKGKGKAPVKFTSGNTELASLEFSENSGATGNPPYTMTLTDADWHEIEVSAVSAMDIKVETVSATSGRVLFIGLKAITQ